LNQIRWKTSKKINHQPCLNVVFTYCFEVRNNFVSLGNIGRKEANNHIENEDQILERAYVQKKRVSLLQIQESCVERNENRVVNQQNQHEKVPVHLWLVNWHYDVPSHLHLIAVYNVVCYYLSAKDNHLRTNRLLLLHNNSDSKTHIVGFPPKFEHNFCLYALI